MRQRHFTHAQPCLSEPCFKAPDIRYTVKIHIYITIKTKEIKKRFFLVCGGVIQWGFPLVFRAGSFCPYAGCQWGVGTSWETPVVWAHWCDNCLYTCTGRCRGRTGPGRVTSETPSRSLWGDKHTILKHMDIIDPQYITLSMNTDDTKASFITTRCWRIPRHSLSVQIHARHFILLNEQFVEWVV